MDLILNNINKSFGDKHVLKDISINAKSGKALGLLGRNGAGKTTTIRIIMDVFKANSGEITLDGQKINYNKIKLGYLPEERGLYPKRKIIDQLVYLAALKGMKKNDAIKSIDYWLDKLEMTEYRNQNLQTLSKGNQQKIQLISCIAHDPDIVILDEPFSGLDPVNAKLLKETVMELISKNKIVIFSSHQMSYVEEFCEEIVIINEGEVVLSGNLKEIIRSYPRNKLVVTALDTQTISNDLSLENYIEHDKLIIKLNKPEDKNMVMSAISQKYDIDGINILEPTLNDIFVEYTTQKEDENATV